MFEQWILKIEKLFLINRDLKMVLEKLVSGIDKCIPGKVVWYSEHISVCSFKRIMTGGCYLMTAVIPTDIYSVFHLA